MEGIVAKLGQIGCLIVALFIVACSGNDSENPDITPASLDLEAPVGTGHNVEFTIYNPAEVERTFDISTSSSLLSVDDEEVIVSPRDSEEVTVYALCPDEAGQFYELLELNARHRSEHYLIEVRLTCHTPSEDFDESDLPNR